jgi:hypothetical protein
MKHGAPVFLACGHFVRWSTIINAARDRRQAAKDIKSVYCVRCQKPQRVLLGDWKPVYRGLGAL